MRLRRNGQEAVRVWRYNLLLAAFFFLGVFAGIVCAERTGSGIREELTSYLSDYLDAAQGQEVSASALGALVVAYLWGPVLAFFCGFTAAGTVLLPLLTTAFSFFPAYAVSCLTAVFGWQGVWLAIGFLGLRCLLTVPCFFLLAPLSFYTAVSRLRASFGRGRFTLADSRGCWLRFVGVLLTMCFGAWGDFQLSSFLLRVLLERVF